MAAAHHTIATTTFPVKYADELKAVVPEQLDSFVVFDLTVVPVGVALRLDVDFGEAIQGSEPLKLWTYQLSDGERICKIAVVGTKAASDMLVSVWLKSQRAEVETGNAFPLKQCPKIMTYSPQIADLWITLSHMVCLIDHFCDHDNWAFLIQNLNGKLLYKKAADGVAPKFRKVCQGNVVLVTHEEYQGMPMYTVCLKNLGVEGIVWKQEGFRQSLMTEQGEMMRQFRKLRVMNKKYKQPLMHAGQLAMAPDYIGCPTGHFANTDPQTFSCPRCPFNHPEGFECPNWIG